MSVPALLDVLVIDDLAYKGGWEQKKILTLVRGIRAGETADPSADVLCAVTFCQAQRVVTVDGKQKLENDLGQALEAVQKQDWALILLDQEFRSGELKNGEVSKPGRGDETFGLSILERIAEDCPDKVGRVVLLTQKKQEQEEFVEITQGNERVNAAVPYLWKGSPETERDQFEFYLLGHGRLTAEQTSRLLQLPPGIVVGSAALRQVYARAARLARVGGPFLILGPAGCGKTTLARYLHHRSRPNGPFVERNVAAITSTLIESELFGFYAGAFEGAKQDTPGPFEQANGGTLFLDEIGELPLLLQPKLNRVVQDRVVQRVGHWQPDKKKKTEADRPPVDIPFDALLLFATNRDVNEMVGSGTFRSDLLERLRGGGTITVPSLKERQEEIPALADAILAAEQARLKRTEIRFGQGVHEFLQGYDHPGNVRGLEGAIQQLVAEKGSGQIVSREALEDVLRSRKATHRTSATLPSAAVPAPPAPPTDTPSFDELLRLIGRTVVTTSDADGAGLKRLDEVVDVLRKRLAGAALSVPGRNPTASVRLLLGTDAELSPGEAIRKLRTLAGYGTGGKVKSNPPPKDKNDLFAELVAAFRAGPADPSR